MASTPAPAPVAQKPKLQWYEGAWIGWPILLVFVGGLIGGACGGAAVAINQQIFQKMESALLKYSLTLVVSVLAVIGYFVLALVFLKAIGK